MYVSLDIETTGLSYERDDIIEIGAVRFDDKKIHDKFQTFIRIDYPLPPIITHITGITDDDLVGAPSIVEIYKDLIKFVGDDPIVGHNISFDLDFLAAKNVILSNPAFDTLQLSSILIPGLPSYSLDMITGMLEIKHKEKHRALDDAEAAAELFQILKKKISEINSETLDEIKMLLERSNWPLKEIFIRTVSGKGEGGEVEKHGVINDPQKNFSLNFNKKEILPFYEEGGPLSKYEEEYEVREPQITMTEKIIDAFEGNYHLLCEAGTGTGKSIAYLLPSIFLSRSKNEKVVIATHTKNLQDQLYKKDIPVLKKAIDAPFKASILKGRKNYLSGERLNLYKKKPFFHDHEITLLIKTLLWLNETKTGDREELSIQGKEYFAWNEICCDAIKCPHNDLSFSTKCFLSRAREKAQKADIIITNHALILSDTVMPTPVLPHYDYLIIDEAHRLEAETTQALTITITQELLEHPLKNLKEILKKQPELKEKIDALVSKIEIFFGLLGMFFEKNIDYANSINNLTLQDQLKGSLEWEKLADSAENICLQGEQLVSSLNDVDEEKKVRIQQEIEILQQLLHNISFIVLEKGMHDTGPQVTWIYQKLDGSLGIKSVPLKIGEHLSGTLLHDKKSIIMTSATLTTNQTFNYIRSQLNLDEHFNEIILPSHFSYPDQVELIIYEDLAAPATPGYFEQSSDIILNAAKENRGKMLVLFTSKKAIEATYLKLMPLLKEKGITILAQNISGGRNKIIELFKQDPENSIIFGTNSFWEGIDIKGTALTSVIIQKLPFDPPDDPVHSQRALLYDDPFYEYQIPRAILLFKQGFGRLIRSTRDTGKVVILDSRILKKRYGEIFLNSLPEGINIKREKFS